MEHLEPKGRRPPLIALPEEIIPPPGAIPFTQTETGLWIPEDLLSEPQSRLPELGFEEPPAMMQYTLTTAGGRDVMGVKLPLSEAITRLQRFSIREIVNLCGRITSLLHFPFKKIGPIPTDLPQGEVFATQYRIAERLLGEHGARVIFALIYRARGGEYDPEQVVVFQERLLLNTLKLALLAVDADAPGHNEHPTTFVEALFIITDHLDPEEGEMDTATDEGRSAMELYISANALFNESTHLLHDFVRAYYLYVETHDLGIPNTADMPGMLARATGVDAAIAWRALFVLHVFWEGRTLAQVDAGKIGVLKSNYLSAVPGVSPEERERWFGLATWEVHALQTRVRRDYSLTDPNFFDVLPFEERPLIAFDDLVLCPALSLLRRVPGSSLQHRCLDKTRFDDAERLNFLDTRGHVAEQYIGELLRYGFGDRFVSEGILQSCAPGKRVCDGIILYPNAVVLVECKTFAVLLATRHATHYAAYRKKWKEAMRKAADQLESTVTLIKAGAFVDLGIDPARIREMYPVISVFEQPVHPLLYRAVIQSDLVGHPLVTRMTKREIAALQLLRIREVELWAMAAEQGHNVLDLLRKKTATQELAELPFHHFLASTGETFYHGHCDWHVQRWKLRIEELAQYFRDLGMPENGPDDTDDA